MKINFIPIKYIGIATRKCGVHESFTNSRKMEILLDAYWAFVFGEAQEVELTQLTTGEKIIFSSVEEWKSFWESHYPEGSYMVFKDRPVYD